MCLKFCDTWEYKYRKEFLNSTMQGHAGREKCTLYCEMHGDTGIVKCGLYRAMQGDNGIEKCTLYRVE